MISKSEAIAAREKAEADAQGDGGNRSSSPSSSSSSSSSNGNGRAVTDKTVAAKAVEKETVAESTTANEQEEGIAKLLVGCQGAGVDVEDIGGFPADNETFNERSFTPAEIAYCRAQASFCGRFAAKETVFKAMGVPSKGAAAPMREAGTHPRPRSGDSRKRTSMERLPAFAEARNNLANYQYLLPPSASRPAARPCGDELFAAYLLRRSITCAKIDSSGLQ
ncbi:unnamed protein product [Tilletia laevis]|nr:hypothetical protein CF335_g5260 [Tilletia laevis]CAD6963574.1 unnamed protein product [Tilletia laevis]